MNNTYFYHDKPLFGFDIGFSTLKIMQLENIDKRPSVVGYGVSRFDHNAIKDGVIVEPETVAKAAYELFDKHLVGEITTRRATVSIPAMRTFVRTIKLPKLSSKELVEAIRMEAEQFIPVPVDELYMDYMIINRTDKEIELLAVAAPKRIVDSYMDTIRLIGLEPVAMETSIAATSRLFVHTDLSDVPTVLIDFGSVSSDITIFDKTIVVTGTVGGGGDNYTDAVRDKLNVTRQEAHVIKSKYGLSYSKKQKDITEALTPMLEQMLKEVRRMIRYYEERYEGADRKIKQIVTMGGGANMPGLSDFMTSALRLPVRMSDPWHHVGFSKLQPPSDIERSMYVTAAGLALTSPREIFL